MSFSVCFAGARASLSNDFIEDNTRGHGNVERSNLPKHGKTNHYVAVLTNQTSKTLVFSPENQRNRTSVIEIGP
jgi:hypothetical protein